jgi:hypothetical protein
VPPSPTPPPPPPPPPPTPEPVPVTFTDRIDTVAGTCPNVTMSVGSYTGYTTMDTTYKKVSCDKLETNMRVKVSGVIMPDGRVQAQEVEKK